jgi:hypothetical protein
MKFKTTRRDASKLLVSAGLGVPLLGGLRSFGLSPAAKNDAPKRLVIVYTPNGTIYDEWARPTGNGDFEFGRVLSPLQAVKNRVLVTRGLANLVPGNGASAHATGVGCLLTNQELNFSGPSPEGFPKGMSIDQHVASHFQTRFPARRFKSLEFGECVWDWMNVRTRLNYAGSNLPLAPESNPARMYEKIFSVGTRARRRTVVSSLFRDFARLKSSISRQDSQILESHIDALREIERELSVQPSFPNTCNASGIEVPQINYENRPVIARLQMDLLVRSLACDQTRVATIQFSNGTTDAAFPWLGFWDRHHDLSHADSDPVAKEKLIAINHWYAEQFKYLLESLASIPESEGDGTLLDHSLVIWVNDFGSGSMHSRQELPIIIAGDQSTFQMGRYLSFDKVPHGRLWVSVCKHFGIDVESFGDPRFCVGGEIPQLRASV